MDNNIWFNDIHILFNKDRLLDIIPLKEMSNGSKINAITRFSLYLSVLLFVITGNYLNLYIVITVVIVSYLMHIFNTQEFFEDNISLENSKNNIKEVECDLPTKENPLMNPLVGDNAQKKKVACQIDDNKVLKKVDKRFCDRLYQNTSNIFSNRFEQRAFYTMPNSKIPNDQTTFAKWLYDIPIACETGDSALLKNTRACAFNNKSLEELKSL